MSASKYFFCGIGGSGMLPLACILRASGAEVAGSDRSLDQGRVADKFAFLEAQGIRLFPQDGSGLVSPDQVLVASAAVEDSVPDIAAARRLGAERITRAELLARLFNAAPMSIGVAGTSGKSTVTGMIAWILHEAGCDPTVMNGAVMKNFASAERPFASALIGHGDVFVSEVDESDGSIALFRPTVAVLNNVSLDHKSLDELRGLFGDFAAEAGKVVANLDDEDVRRLAETVPADRLTGFSFEGRAAALSGGAIEAGDGFIRFAVRAGTEERLVTLRLWGAHNARNALAAIGAARAAGVPLDQASAALESFRGLRRRFEIVGERNGVTVVDDFAHNPDKIAATLAAARAGLSGRLLLFFQPHGYGPLRLMKEALVDTFVENMGEDDVLILSDPVYYGGTVDRSVGSEDVVAAIRAAGRRAEHIADRAACGDRLVALARPGDRILIMGARDDTLSDFARQVLAGL
ncbi:MAG: UDP-N-acetylmuramate--alanine ligase [Sphingomonadales bacterium]|jgi:UDP-N-acetylmuramate--alanine ligase|nr:UDP-N-acetylmuramate--alanine ligase [Sphingomonadales bacterium]